MGWITTLLQLLPAIMAAFTQLMPLIQAIINAFTHKAATGNWVAATDPNWLLYVPGQTLIGTAIAGVILCLQPRANEMARFWREAKEAERIGLAQLQESRKQAAKAFQLRSELESLSPVHQASVTR